jgi:hypothetical protein
LTISQAISSSIRGRNSVSTFEDHWQKILVSSGDAGDIFASIREEAINHYLAKHFQLDRAKYSIKRALVCKVDDNGTTRDLPVTITVSAKSPLIVNFDPFTERSGAPIKGNWTELGAPEPSPNLNQGNIQVRVDQVAFSVEWPSVYTPGQKYVWSPSPILFEAEAYIQLTTINEPDDESRHFLNLQLIKARFDRPERVILEQELDNLITHLPPADAAIVVKHAVDKFDELLVIALNTAAVELAPRFAANLEIPVPVIAKKCLVPRSLLVSDNIATVSLGLAEEHLRAMADQALSRALTEVDLALQEDIAAAGGLRNLVVKDGAQVNWEDLEALRKLEILSADDIASKLVRTREVASRQETRAHSDIQRSESRAAAVGITVANVKDGVGIALNEYLLNSLAATFARSSPVHCTDWLPLGAVRGRVCYWTRIYDADVSVGENAGNLLVGGSVGVDVGGSVEGCVRKFWDCSWKWACAELRMAIVGRPGIELSLLQSKYIAFSAKIIGNLTLETNLPFPFDKVVEAVGSLVWEGVKAVLNVFLGQIQIVLVPPRLEIPKQTTAIVLSDFKPRYFAYLGGPDSKKRFAAYSVGLAAV